MNKTTYIEFRKKREISAIISDTFKFIRGNYKVLFSVFLKVAGLPFLLLIVAALYNSYSSLQTNPEDFGNPFAVLSNSDAIASSIVLYLVLFIYVTFLYAGVLGAIKSYIKNEGSIEVSEVVEDVKSRTMLILGTGFSKFVLLMIAWMLCLLPGLFLFAPLILVLPILMFENKGFSESFQGAFQLIKQDWVMSAITIGFGFIIWYIFSFVLSIPLLIYFFIKMVVVVQEGSLDDMNSLIDIPFITLTALASILQYLIYIIMPIVAAFVYYNLNEKENQSGTLDLIDTIGKDNA